jgi:hypothetical protein
MLENARFAVAGVVCLVAAMVAIGCSSDDDKDMTSNPSSSTATQSVGSGQGSGTPTSGSSASANKDLNIEEKDFSFEMPDTVRGGLVKISAKNTGKEPHQAQLMRLNDGVTQQQFQATLQQGDIEAMLKMVTLTGGVNSIPAGASQVAYDNLQPGNYVMLCLLEAEDGMPHFAKGMIKFFNVTPGDSSDASPPKASGTVVMADFNFLGDVTKLDAKKTTLEVKNGGPQPHELTVIKLNNGVTVDQLKAMLNSDTPPPGPPPIDDAGGLGAIQANQTGWVDLDLKAGNYAFVCFVPDPATGKPHAALGMIKAIEVK